MTGKNPEPENGKKKHSHSDRMSWDDYFMAIAELASKRATCPRRSVGAVLVKNKRIIATGYNGSPPGQPHCIDVGCLMVDGHCIRTIHAEENAIVFCARAGIPVEGATLYITSSPCQHCAKVIIASGITEVVYGDEYWASEHAKQFLAGSEIKLRKSGPKNA